MVHCKFFSVVAQASKLPFWSEMKVKHMGKLENYVDGAYEANTTTVRL